MGNAASGMPAAGHRLRGRTALVTGASMGIGRSVALRLASEGADIVVHHHGDAAGAEATAAAAGDFGVRTGIFKQDLSVRDAGAHLVDRLRAASYSPDIVVFNAFLGLRQPFEEIGSSDLHAQINVGYAATIQMLQAFLPLMRQRGWGRAITIGSVQQVRPNPSLIVYATLKAALANLAQALSGIYAASGITINNVAPGMIETETSLVYLSDDAVRKDMIEQIPAGFIGVPSDIAALIAFLCSDEARYITGQTVFADGGLGLNTKAKFISAAGRLETNRDGR